MFYRFIKNKKGIDYPILLILLTGAALLFLYSNIEGAISEKRDIGYSQLSLLKNVQESEKVLFFLDKSAANSIDKSLYLLANNGGFYKENKCGMKGNYQKWKSKSTDCYPEMLSNLKGFFSDEFNNHLKDHPTREFFRNEYFFSIYDKKIIGEPFRDLSIDINNKENKKIGEYRYNPSFTLNHDLSFLNNITNDAEDLFNTCKNEPPPTLNNCIKQNIKRYKSTKPELYEKWEFNLDSGVASFAVTTTKELWFFGEDGFLEQDFKIKFALSFLR